MDQYACIMYFICNASIMYLLDINNSRFIESIKNNENWDITKINDFTEISLIKKAARFDPSKNMVRTKL